MPPIPETQKSAAIEESEAPLILTAHDLERQDKREDVEKGTES